MKILFIGANEVNFCNYLHKNKVATTSQLHRDILKVSYSLCCRKLKFFEKKGLVQKLSGVESFDGCYAYTLGKNGIKIVFANNQGKIVHRRYKSNSVAHDLHLVDIRNVLIRMKAVKRYFTENQIQTYQDFNSEKELEAFKTSYCDAMLSVQSPGKSMVNMALEFEVSEKSFSDYQTKVYDLYRKEEIVAALYICTDKRVEEKIKKVEKKMFPNVHKKIHFIQLDNFFRSNSLVTFLNQDNKKIELS